MISAVVALQELSRLLFKSSSTQPVCHTWNIVDGSQEDGWLSWESLGLKVQVWLHFMILDIAYYKYKHFGSLIYYFSLSI
jgi:hypothetical protein